MIKRFLCPDDEEEESFEIVISRIKYSLMAKLIGESLVGDIKKLISEFPDAMKDFADGGELIPASNNYDSNIDIDISERIKMNFKIPFYDFPHPRMKFELDGKWESVELWRVYDVDENGEHILDDLRAIDIIRMIYRNSKDEQHFYDAIKKGFHKFEKWKKKCRGRGRQKRAYQKRDMDFKDFMKVGKASGDVKINSIPTLGWARFVLRGVVGKRDIFMSVTKDGYRVECRSPTLLSGREKIYRFHRYYADKMGKKSRDLTRSKYTRRSQITKQMKACDYMHGIYCYIDEHGEDSDEDIVAWLETAKRY